MLNNPEIATGQNIFLQQHCVVVYIGMAFIQVHTYIYRVTFAFENPNFWKQFTTKCIKKVPFLQHLPPTAWHSDVPNRV